MTVSANTVMHDKPFSRPAPGALLAMLLLPTLAAADIGDDIGLTRLQRELGASMPDGSGIEVVQVEASVKLEDGGIAYAPDFANAEFAGKTIIDATRKGSAASGHATAVGRIFYGAITSPARGIKRVDSYLAGDWYVRGFLLPVPVIGSLGPQPALTSSRIANHSFVGDFGKGNAELLRRMDWVIETDEFINVAGFNGGNTPIAASAYNVIAVDHVSAARIVGSAKVDDLYTASRPRPHIVVPEANPSRATPWVSAAVALLVETAHRNKKLSDDPEQDSIKNRSGDIIYNAERSEVIKAALMAGAERESANAEHGNIKSYRGSGADRTRNGLDRRYGAGQLSIYNSYHVIAAGEQNSREDATNDKGKISATGFDYDPAFGGADDSNTEGTYTFTTTATEAEFFASLVWSLDIDGGIENIFVGAATLHDLNLWLYDVSDPDDWQKVASSDSSTDNTETLWLRLKANTDYALRVSSVGPFRHDYALAWRLSL